VLVLQLEPSARQLPLKQQPLLQVLPGQQGAPGVPHRAHRPVVEVELHTEPAAQRSVPPAPVQQVSPGLPQDEQMLLRQDRPAPQVGVVDPQHGCPEAPQPAHFPPEHTPGLVPGVPPVPVVVGPQDVDSATHCSL
jgi:hypothetical protein